MGFLVLVVNSLVAAALIAALFYSANLSISTIVLITLVGLTATFALQVFVGQFIAKRTAHPEYDEVRFPKEN